MIALKSCRELLGEDCPMSDEEIIELQIQLRAIVELLLSDEEQQA